MRRQVESKIYFDWIFYLTWVISIVLVGTAFIQEVSAMNPIMTTNRNANKMRFVKYSQKEIDRFLRKLGYSEDYKGDIIRNSKGTELRFFSWIKNKVIIISCDGNVKQLDLPGGRVWLNDASNIIAWSKNKEIIFRNGATTKGIMNIFGADANGDFFIIRPIWEPNKSMDDKTSIYSTVQPNKPLSEVRMTDPHSRLFRIDNDVLLIGDDPDDPTGSLLAYRFAWQNGILTKIKEIRIERPSKAPSPFNVVDYNPETNEVVVIDSRDYPSSSIWYIYNFETGKMRSIGKSTSYGFYLECDILKSWKYR